MLITETYRAEQAALHAKGDYGTASLQYGKTVADLLQRTGASSLLDYGCGSKRSLLQALQLPPEVVYEGYDPAIPEYAEPPVPAELVCCIDVLEHIEPSLLDNVLDHLASLCDPYGFFTVHTGPARKVLSDGRNAHLTQQGPDWWLPRFKQHFDVLAVNAIPSGFAIVVRSSRSKASLALPGPLVLPAAGPSGSGAANPGQTQAATASNAQLVFKYRGHRIVLGAAGPDDLQRLQAQLKQQSAAIEWLDAMDEGAVVLDVGADAGLHALYAAVARKSSVFAVEAGAGRRAALADNIAANQAGAQVTVLPLALSDGSGGLTIDRLVASGSVLQPNCLRIGAGVDAAAALRGAMNVLADTRLTGVLLDASGGGTGDDGEPARLLAEAGWVPDEEMRARAEVRTYRRLAAPWARLPTIVPAPTARGRAVLSHVLQRVATAKVTEDPFPYAVIDEILPPDYYAEALEHFPTAASLRPLSETGRVSKGAYEERLVVLFTDEEFSRMTAAQQRFWTEFAGWMYSDVFLNAFVAKFASALEPRLARILAASDSLRVRGDALLVNDQTNYAVGPHTDAPHRLVTFLFYLPKDDSMRDLGTSVYRPKNPNFVCWGGPHHPFDKFNHVRTVEFLPNRLLVFPKTEKSFHGVEKIAREGINRPLLINNIRLLNAVTH